jgi:SAM-dependent methyltransferase
MDRDTLKAYDIHAADYAKDWHDQPAPADLHVIVRRFFQKGATADIGCGSGREVGWLNANGFPAVGFDASRGLLAEAKHRYPDAEFRLAALPQLDGIAAGSFDNVLCETVIMHLPRGAIAPSARRLIEIVRPGGVLYLSWRVETDDRRDNNGRLYTAFDNNLVLDELRGTTMLLDEDIVSASSGKIIHRLIARK